MPLRKFKTKPVIVEAIQLTRDNIKEIKSLVGHHNYTEKSWDPVNLYLDTGHGEAVVEPGSWIIQDGNGKFYPCIDSEFQRKYEEPQANPQTPARK